MAVAVSRVNEVLIVVIIVIVVSRIQHGTAAIDLDVGHRLSRHAGRQSSVIGARQLVRTIDPHVGRRRVHGGVVTPVNHRQTPT